MKTIRKVVGIDPSLKNMGIACYTLGEAEPVLSVKSFGTVPADGENFYRIQKLLGKVRAEIDGSTVVFVEDYAYGAGKGKNGASSLAQLGELGGMLQFLTLRVTGVLPVRVGIGEWKKFMCDNGSLPKDRFIFEVYKKLRIECANNDEAAAVGIADFGLGVLGLLPRTRKIHAYESRKMVDFQKKNSAVLHALATVFSVPASLL